MQSLLVRLSACNQQHRSTHGICLLNLILTRCLPQGPVLDTSVRRITLPKDLNSCLSSPTSSRIVEGVPKIAPCLNSNSFRLGSSNSFNIFTKNQIVFFFSRTNRSKYFCGCSSMVFARESRRGWMRSKGREPFRAPGEVVSQKYLIKCPGRLGFYYVCHF